MNLEEYIAHQEENLASTPSTLERRNMLSKVLIVPFFLFIIGVTTFEENRGTSLAVVIAFFAYSSICSYHYIHRIRTLKQIIKQQLEGNSTG